MRKVCSGCWWKGLLPYFAFLLIVNGDLAEPCITGFCFHFVIFRLTLVRDNQGYIGREMQRNAATITYSNHYVKE